MDSIDTHQIRVTVKMLFRCKDEVLFYSTPEGVRDFPGGGVEFGEQLVDALKRELMEELHYKLVDIPKLVDVKSFTPEDRSVHHLIIAYTIELPEKIEFTWHDTDASPPSDIAFHWINKRDIASQHFYPNHEALLLKACEM